MSHERTGLYNMKPHHLEKAGEIAKRFVGFTDGLRVLFLIQRHSDGGHINNSKLRSYISRNHDEWIRSLAKLLQEMEQYPEIPLRIYQTLNKRNVEKGIKQFKYLMLDADFYDNDTRRWFYIDIRNRFISAIMKPSSKETSYFLWDCDTLDDTSLYNLRKEIEKNGGTIVTEYPSKTGLHIISGPFNHTKVAKPENISVNTDGMMLLTYSNKTI